MDPVIWDFGGEGLVFGGGEWSGGAPNGLYLERVVQCVRLRVKKATISVKCKGCTVLIKAGGLVIIWGNR